MCSSLKKQQSSKTVTVKESRRQRENTCGYLRKHSVRSLSHRPERLRLDPMMSVGTEQLRCKTNKDKNSNKTLVYVWFVESDETLSSSMIGSEGGDAEPARAES